MLFRDEEAGDGFGWLGFDIRKRNRRGLLTVDIDHMTQTCDLKILKMIRSTSSHRLCAKFRNVMIIPIFDLISNRCPTRE